MITIDDTSPEKTLAERLRRVAEARRLPLSDLTALKQALTHKSLVPDHTLDSNERLEFLGDSVLGMVVVEFLYDRFPKRGEGELAQAKALIVCKDALAAAARRMDLAPLMRLGRTEEAMGGRNRDSIIADAVEALIAAVYRERGYPAARDFILEILAPEIAAVAEERDWRDPKTVLQEQRQAAHLSSPEYVLTAERGRPHDRTFTIAVKLDGVTMGTGQGKTKKEAQQAAAEAALGKMAPPPPIMGESE